ncbi:galactokinase [Nocardioides panacisoli]|uniref:Galactokinase n=1 Tax=Nocardioides panacisoli TaxID=627624 RepID=A0ABP7I5R2_9ACTN
MTVRWRAPGRVNLIGEHTDYNGGLALPFAIEHGCTAEVGLAPGRDLHVATSAQEADDVRLTAADLAALPGSDGPVWARYVLGPLWVLRERGYDVPPLEVRVDSDVPSGSGLSSSAAVVCSVTSAVDDLLELGLSPDDLLAVARAAENDVVGAPTGGLDQMASLRCRVGEVLLCDFATTTTENVPADLAADGLTVLVVDTLVRHSHADGEYAARRRGCEAAAAVLGLPALGALRTDDLAAALARLEDDEQARYVRHVVSEDDRVRRTAELLRAGRTAGIGSLLTASHASLRDDFRVTVPELDLAVETLLAAGALGARMTGGGFGGSVIALVEEGRATDAAAATAEAFGRAGYRSPAWFTTLPSAGARRA